MAIIYGLTGTMEFPLLGPKISGLVNGRAAALVGMVLLITGIGFKLGVSPSTCGRQTFTKARPPR